MYPVRFFRIPALTALCWFILTGCSRASDNGDSRPDTIGINDESAQAWRWADSVVNAMTLEEMAGQVIAPAIYTDTLPSSVRKMRAYMVDLQCGGICFHKGDTASFATLARLTGSQAKIPPFLAIDAEWGLGMRLKGGSVFPKNYQLRDCSQDQLYDYGLKSGREAKAIGVNMVLGPVLDVAPGPESVMYERSYGSDPCKVAELGCAYARGLMDAGILPVAKHFPGHGHTSADSHKALPCISSTRRELDSLDLAPFIKYVQAGFPGIMPGHLCVPALCGDSVPVTYSSAALQGYLRGQLHFGGLIISDALNMEGASTRSSSGPPPPVLALLAGVDMILAPADSYLTKRQIIDSIESGELPLGILAAHCRRILFYKYLYQMTGVTP